MLIAIDGACKRNGKPDCNSVGVAWFITETDMFYRHEFELESTSQRGEINGLLTALRHAVLYASPEEDIVIVTDSEYLHNTVMKGWYDKWRRNSWIGSTGTTVKNADLWKSVATLLDTLNSCGERVYLQWTKGHLMTYKPQAVASALAKDHTGVGLYSNILSMVSRKSERDRIINDFKFNRVKHDYMNPDDDTCALWVTVNMTADSLAFYLMQQLDSIAQSAD